jgi:FkbM family methyltransferase
MKNKLNLLLRYLNLKIVKINNAKTFALTKQGRRVAPWFNVNGDKTLRLDYDLKANSLVLDLGGYEGEWASEIYCKYGSKILIFEPNQDFADTIINKFSHNNKVSVFNFGLASSNRTEKFFVNENSSSIYAESKEFTTIELKNASEFLEDRLIENVDLIKINIEGGEYEFLDTLISSGKIKIFDNIQVQFHDFVPDSDNLMKKIQNSLEETHYRTYHFEYVWENWKRK